MRLKLCSSQKIAVTNQELEHINYARGNLWVLEPLRESKKTPIKYPRIDQVVAKSAKHKKFKLRLDSDEATKERQNGPKRTGQNNIFMQHRTVSYKTKWLLPTKLLTLYKKKKYLVKGRQFHKPLIVQFPIWFNIDIDGCYQVNQMQIRCKDKSFSRP